MQQQGGSILPAEYQQVKWIESTNAYPDSGLCLIEISNVNINSSNLRTRAKVSDWQYTGRPYGEYIFSTLTPLQTGLWRLLSHENNIKASVYDSQNDQVLMRMISDFEFDFTNTSITINNNTYTLPNGTTDTVGFIRIFIASKFKLHYLYVYNGLSLSMRLIPCYRKSDNEPGMYDIVNDVFYTNAGTGSFAVGPDV